MPNFEFEVLDARIASALNKIIHNSHFKRRISLEEQKAQKQDRFLRGRQIAYLIYEYFRVIGSRWFCRKLRRLVHYQLYEMMIFRNSILSGTEYSLSMTKVPHDDILEGLYKLRIRVSEKLKTVLELYDLEIHQKKSKPEYYRLKTMVKRSIEQEIRNKNFGSQKWKFWEERLWSRIRGQNSENKEFLEIVGNGKQTGSVWKETIVVSATIWISVEKLHHQIRLRILSCGRVSENHREPEVPEAGVPVVECLDGLARITLEEVAPIHSVKNGTLQNACSTRPRVCCRFGEKFSVAHRQVDEQLTKRSKKNDDKSAVAMLKKGDWQWKRTCYRPGSRSIRATW